MQIEITTQHIYTAVASLMAVIGWAVAWQEDVKSKRLLSQQKDKHDAEIKELQKEYLIINSDLSNKLKEQSNKHEQVIEELTKESEEQLKDLAKTCQDAIESQQKASNEVIAQQKETIELYEKWMANLNLLIHVGEQNVREVDEKGVFDSEDDLGVWFKAIKDMQEAINKFKVEKKVLEEQQTQ